MKIKKGDNVKIISGKDRGKTGKVMRSIPAEQAIVVEGLNMVTKHIRATANRKGQRIKLPAALDVSNVQLVCPKCGKSTRVGYKVMEDKKMRICRKCNAEF
jgi:large subunit ribosomal protein L24